MFRLSYFTQQELDVAKVYHNDDKNDSIIVKLFFRRFWEFLLSKIPPTLSPFCLLILGLLCDTTSFVYSVINSRFFFERLNYWVRIYNFVGLCLYFQFSNLGLMQAQRTNTPPPVYLFLHQAVNSFIYIFELLKYALSIDSFCDSFTFHLVFLMAIDFYFYAWQEYSTRRSNLLFINGPYEGLFVLSLIYLFLGLYPRFTVFFISDICEYIVLCVFGLQALLIICDVVYKCIQNHNFIRNSILTTLPFIFSLALIALNFYTIDPDNPYFIFTAGLLLEFQAQQLFIGHIVGRSPSQISDFSLNIIWPLFLVPLVLEEDNYLFYKILFILMVISVLILDFRVIFDLKKVLKFSLFRAQNNNNLQDDVAVDVMKVNDEKIESLQ